MTKTTGSTSTRTESSTQAQDTQNNNKETNLEPEKSSNPEGNKASGTKNDSKGDKGEEESEEKSSILGTVGTIAAGAAGAAALATVAPGLVGSVLGTGEAAGGDPVAQVAAAGTANNAASQNGTQPSLFDITSGSFLKNGSPHSSNGFAMPPMGMVNGVDSYASSSVPQLPSTHDFGLGLNSQTNLKPLIGLPSGNVNNTIGDIGIGVGSGIGISIGSGIGVASGIGIGGIGVGGIGFGSVVTAF